VVNAVGSVTVTLHSGVTLAPLCFSNGGIKGLLAALRLHAAVVRSAEQPHTYLLNDVRDPLQRSMAMLQLQQVPSLSLSLMLQLQQVHSLSLSLSPSLMLQLQQVHSLSLSLSLSLMLQLQQVHDRAAWRAVSAAAPSTSSAAAAAASLVEVRRNPH
jgi:hypothetical protein